MSAAIKIAVVGASGRMGRMIIESALKDAGVSLVAAIDQPGTSAIGKDAGELVGQPCGDVRRRGWHRAGRLSDRFHPP